MQVVPGAGGGVGVTHVGVTIEPGCNSDVSLSAIAGPPADRTRVRHTLYICCDMVGDTWSWGERQGVNMQSNIHTEFKLMCVMASDVTSYQF